MHIYVSISCPDKYLFLLSDFRLVEMRRRLSKAYALLRKARRDFAIAESHLRSRDYAAASAAYLSVIRELLDEFSKGKCVSDEMAEEVSASVLIPKYVTEAAEGNVEYDEIRQNLRSADNEGASSAIEKRDAAKRMIDYVFAYVQRS